jgi:[ribosomal protein S18]-alanine N-acetyltransferase
MTKTLIRYTAHSDFPRLLQIDQDSFPRGVAYDSAELLYFMNRTGAETIVLEKTGTIVAFLIMEIHRNRRMANIVTLDVDKNHRRLGYATQLLRRTEEILASYGVEIYDLQVDVNNSGAIRFYKGHGFEMVRVLRRYYPNGNDAYLMVKELVKDD